MLTLIGMLIMVIYSMNEAGKPENWAWMGFEKSPNSTNTEKTNDAPASTTPTADSNSAAINEASTPTKAIETREAVSRETGEAITPSKSVAVRSEAIRLTELSPSFQQRNQPSALPLESAKFWSSFFENLSTTEQVQWMELLEGLHSELPLAQRPPASETQLKLIARAEKEREVFNNKMLDRLSSIPHASKKRSQVSQEYFDADKFWQERISPALTAFLKAQDLTLVQRQAVIDLQHHLDADALNFVQDKTAVGWTGDSVAWKRCWNRIYQTKIEDPTFVKRIQLIGQPREFRGKAIKVYGFVRDIEIRTAASDSSIAGPTVAGSQANNGSEVTYYIVWVQPSDSEVGPYCVYCLNLPAELPRSRQELTEFQQLATIDGIFFKNRTYEAADRTVQYCPLILADGFKLKPPPMKLNRTWMAAALALVPIFGVGIVWYAVRSTVSRKRLPSKKQQEETNVFLDDLKNDPSIKTDLEQIQAIAEHEDDIL